MKCPICQYKLVKIHQNTDLEFTFYECPVTISYLYPDADEPEVRNHYQCATSISSEILQHSYYTEQFCIEIGFITNEYFDRGIEVRSVRLEPYTSYKMHGPDIIGENNVTNLHLDELFEWDDPTILDNKTLDEMLKKIKLYTTFL